MSIPFEKMKVAELKKIATNYGIKKEDIEGNGINGRVLGTDYVRVLNEYKLKESNPKKTKKEVEPKKPKKEVEAKTKKETKKTKKSKKEVEQKKTKRQSMSDSEKATESSEREKVYKKSSKTKSYDSDKTITMEEELLQELFKKSISESETITIEELDKEKLRNAFIECITK